MVFYERVEVSFLTSFLNFHKNNLFGYIKCENDEWEFKTVNNESLFVSRQENNRVKILIWRTQYVRR